MNTEDITSDYHHITVGRAGGESAAGGGRLLLVKQQRHVRQIG